MPTRKRTVSLIASATEIVCALGRRDWLVGRSHECDFPARCGLAAPAHRAQIQDRRHQRRDRRAACRPSCARASPSIASTASALKALQPDVIVTQDHCEVCAVSLSDVEAATCTWTGRPVEIVSLKPDSTADVYADIRRVADCASTPSRRARPWSANAAAHRCRARPRRRPSTAARRLHRMGRATDGRRQLDARADRGRRRPQPLRRGRQAFRLDAVGRAGRRRSRGDHRRPCGYGLERCLEELPLLEAQARLGALAGRSQRPRLLRRRQRLLQPPRPASRRQRRDAGRDDSS